MFLCYYNYNKGGTKMKVKDLIDKVELVYTENVKFFDFENDAYLDTIDCFKLYENDYKIKDNDVYRFTWHNSDLWIYI